MATAVELSDADWFGREPVGALDGGRLPSLAALAAREQERSVVRCVLVTHVHRQALGYVLTLNEVYPVESIVAIPYSADPAAVSDLRDHGFEVVVPGDVADTFAAAAEVCEKGLARSSQPLVVQEVGGYLAEATARLGGYDHFRGIVEDTNNGHWRYQRFGPHGCPVLSMAQSPLKDIEDTIIGDAVLFSVERILREELNAITQGIRASVLGVGKIGMSTAIALRGREAVVSVYDINPAKNILARVLGFFPRPLREVLSDAHLIIGCTGQTSIRAVDVPHIADGAILVSASSKDVELPVAELGRACEPTRVSDVTTRYRQPDGRVFYLLNNGRPVNFRDDSVLGTILDMIYSELFVCLREVANNRAPQGLSCSPPPLQDEVAKVWLRHHSRVFAADPDDKVWSYPDSLQLGLPR